MIHEQNQLLAYPQGNACTHIINDAINVLGDPSSVETKMTTTPSGM